MNVRVLRAECGFSRAETDRLVVERLRYRHGQLTEWVDYRPTWDPRRWTERDWTAGGLRGDIE